MMKKIEKGFTLVELLVVIAILGILMGVLFPTVTSVMHKAKLTECTMKGRKLHQAILQAGLDDARDQDELAMWPRTEKNKNDDSTLITGQVFSDSVSYFKELFDLERYGQKDCDPYIKDVEVSVLYGCGVPGFDGKNIQPRNVMWIVARGIDSSMPEVVPVMITRNAEYTKLFTSGTFSGSETTAVGLGKENGGESDTPFGTKSVVIVRRGGAVDVIESRYSKLRDIYKQQSFTISSDAEFSYLPTGGE